MVWHYIALGKPMQNAFIKTFDGRLREGLPNEEVSTSLADAQQKLDDWRRDYNEVRPHGAIGNKPPITLTNSDGVTSTQT